MWRTIHAAHAPIGNGQMWIALARIEFASAPL
jgi:hypothetical protein